MKTNKLLKLISIFTVLLFITSCVDDSDFELPNTTVTEPDLSGFTKINFSALIDRYNDAVDAGNSVGLFELDEEKVYIEAYVVSSDQGGNFFEELIIQNNTNGGDTSVDGNDVRRGIRVEVNVRSLSDTFEFGRKIYIKLNGLAIGQNHGTYVIGKSAGSGIDQIQEYEYLDFIGRYPEVVNITPKTIAIGDLTGLDENTLVQFEDVQFISAYILPTIATFAGAASDQFDGFRTLESCADGGSIDLQTSTFADFKSLLLPQNRGVIQGVFTRNFNDSANVLVINTPNDIDFNNSNRCDPLFGEDFSEAIDNTNLNINGWTNFAEAGSEKWTEQVFDGNGYTEFSAFLTNDAVNIGWLISPGIDMDGQSNEILKFKTAQHHLDSSANTLEVFVSTDFDGTNVLLATWEPINATLATINDSWYDFIDSGQIDISNYTGTLYIAFKYTGSGTDTDLDGAYFVDDVSVSVL